MGNKGTKKAPPEPTAPPLPEESSPDVFVGSDQKDYGKPYRFLPPPIHYSQMHDNNYMSMICVNVEQQCGWCGDRETAVLH